MKNSHHIDVKQIIVDILKPGTDTDSVKIMTINTSATAAGVQHVAVEAHFKEDPAVIFSLVLHF